MEKIKALVININFEGENNFKILRVRRSDGEVISALGKLEDVEENDSLILRGDFRINPVYGKEFVVKDFEYDESRKLDTIIKFLSSKEIKGIGYKTASKIVEKFGEDTIDIIKNKPKELLKVNGIGPKNLNSIRNSINKLGPIFDTLVFLTYLGLGPALSYKVIEEFKENTKEEVSENPYILMKKIDGIGFRIADKIARKLGIPEDSPFRIKSFLLFLLEQALNDGHTFLYKQNLLEKAAKEINIDYQTSENLINELLREGEIVLIEECVYLQFVYKIEKKIVEKIKILNIFKLPEGELDFSSIKEIEKDWSLELDSTQKQTLKEVLQGKLAVLTGGPGTGKTTLLKFMAFLLINNRKVVSIAAPTGRAARRITETTGFEAKTIHRMLEYIPGREIFLKNRFNPLEAEVVIIDEASMIDIFIFYRLLDALSPETQLILVGDHYQLPPVGPGYVFRDIVISGKLKTFYLDKIYRRDKQSLISYNAYLIKKGKKPELPAENKNIFDFYFIKQVEEKRILNTIIKLYTERLPKQFNINLFSDDIQVLSPMYKGIIGVDNLNSTLQEILNKKSQELWRDGSGLRIGDKVMQTRNDYEKEVFNGDIGIVKRLNNTGKYLDVEFYNREIRYYNREIKDLALAYAISIHKSQGCEYDYVILPIIKKQKIMLQRNLIYTAVTRAKKMVIFVGEWDALKYAIMNNSPLERNSLILNFIKKEFN